MEDFSIKEKFIMVMCILSALMTLRVLVFWDNFKKADYSYNQYTSNMLTMREDDKAKKQAEYEAAVAKNKAEWEAYREHRKNEYDYFQYGGPNAKAEYEQRLKDGTVTPNKY